MNKPRQERRVVHVTASITSSGGGIPPVIFSLARETQQLGGGVVVAGLRDGHPVLDTLHEGGKVIGGGCWGPRALGYSPELRRALPPEVRGSDVLHVHGLWMYPGWLARTLGERNGCKRVVSPHGMLEPWALKRSSFKKRLAGWIFENRNLRTADCLHALCANEARSFRQFGLQNPIAVIPNGVALDGLKAADVAGQGWGQSPELAGKRILLFLSRVHPKKGLPDLLRAWAATRAHEQNWILVVVGPDEVGHTAEMRQLAAELGIEAGVRFEGPAYGLQKSSFLAAADGFVLPSHSEGFSMAVLEAAAAGRPVLLTKECNFPELAAAGAAIEVAAGQAGVLEGLRQFLALTRDQRSQMGMKGRELVTRFYSWSFVGSQMTRVYDWLNGEGPRPDCVEWG